MPARVPWLSSHRVRLSPDADHGLRRLAGRAGLSKVIENREVSRGATPPSRPCSTWRWCRHLRAVRHRPRRACRSALQIVAPRLRMIGRCWRIGANGRKPHLARATFFPPLPPVESLSPRKAFGIARPESATNLGHVRRAIDRLGLPADRLRQCAGTGALPARLFPGSGTTTATISSPGLGPQEPARGCSSSGRTRPRCCRSPHPLFRWSMQRARENVGNGKGQVARLSPREGEVISTACCARLPTRPSRRLRAVQPAARSRPACGAGTTASLRSNGCSSPDWSPRRRDAAPSNGSTTSPSACCRPIYRRCRHRRAEEHSASCCAGRPRAGRRHRVRSARLFRLGVADTKARLATGRDGDLLPVAVEGWNKPAYLDPAARHRAGRGTGAGWRRSIR